jgi:hypothetical protein
LTGLWWGVGILALGHYSLNAGAPETIAYVFGGIYTAIAVVPLGMLVYYSLLGGALSDARVFVRAPTFALGQDITVAIQQQARRPLEILGAEAGLRCDVTTRTRRGGKTSYSTHKHYEELQSVSDALTTRSGEQLQFSCAVPVPADEKPSTQSKAYPRYKWGIRVKLQIKDCPDYRASFPITLVKGEEVAGADSGTEQ